MCVTTLSTPIMDLLSEEFLVGLTLGGGVDERRKVDSSAVDPRGDVLEMAHDAPSGAHRAPQAGRSAHLEDRGDRRSASHRARRVAILADPMPMPSERRDFTAAGAPRAAHRMLTRDRIPQSSGTPLVVAGGDNRGPTAPKSLWTRDEFVGATEAI